MSSRQGESEQAPARPGEAARKRAAVETFSRNEVALRRTARRYSLCADDADDALQRGLEIVLTKAPSEDPRELIRWTQTVVKHEALAVRRERERILGGPTAALAEGEPEDWVALIPDERAGPAERAERREAIARSREALQALKPQELRALTLLAEGYSYAEIGEIAGFSQTKVNRCLAEGRERFRRFFSDDAEEQRCAKMRPLLSAFCDGEASPERRGELREHLRACAGCRATLRAYRAAPATAAALAPSLPASRSLLERAHDLLGGLSSRLDGSAGADAAISQVAAAGGARGAGMAALAKVMAICVGTAGGAAACVATGVIPAPIEVGHRQAKAPRLERRIAPIVETEWRGDDGVDYDVVPEPSPQPVAPAEKPDPAPQQPAAPPPSPPAAPAATAGAVEYAPPPAPVSEPSSAGGPAGSDSAGSAAGEFGP
jgi:RNA polymerase sigma factor (sigma-70 family)